MKLRKDSLGRSEIVGDAWDEVGLIFDKALNAGSYSPPQPTRFTTTVYRQRQRRFGGAKFWDRETDFETNTAEEAERKAQKYLADKKWQFVPYA